MAYVLITHKKISAIRRRIGERANIFDCIFNLGEQIACGLSVTKLVGYVVQCRINILFGKGRKSIGIFI